MLGVFCFKKNRVPIFHFVTIGIDGAKRLPRPTGLADTKRHQNFKKPQSNLGLFF